MLLWSSFESAIIFLPGLRCRVWYAAQVPFENDDAFDRRVDDLLVAIESILIFYRTETGTAQRPDLRTGINYS
ncbi:hypothetical protein WK29_22530 [Burkholderia vietnamiensis]|nr:hypothetical protein WK29_22530 [Burkholderia vietnamiensis]